MRVRRWVLMAAGFIILVVPFWAAGQDQGRRASGATTGVPQGGNGRMGMGGPGTLGTVTSVGVDRFEIRKADGSTQTVMVSESTHYRQGREQEIGLEDLKPGDHVMVRGEASGNQGFTASLVRRVTDEEMARFQQMGGERTFGEIVSIKDNQITVRSQWQGNRTVVVSGQTTFTKDGQPSTLDALKVGDRILATGKDDKGQLVASQVMSGNMQYMMRQRPPRPEGNGSH